MEIERNKTMKSNSTALLTLHSETLCSTLTRFQINTKLKKHITITTFNPNPHLNHDVHYIQLGGSEKKSSDDNGSGTLTALIVDDGAMCRKVCGMMMLGIYGVTIDLLF